MANAFSMEFFVNRAKRLDPSSGVKCIEETDGVYSVVVKKSEGQAINTGVLVTTSLLLAALGVLMIYVLIKACRFKHRDTQEARPLVSSDCSELRSNLETLST